MGPALFPAGEQQIDRPTAHRHCVGIVVYVGPRETYLGNEHERQPGAEREVRPFRKQHAHGAIRQEDGQEYGYGRYQARRIEHHVRIVAGRQPHGERGENVAAAGS